MENLLYLLPALACPIGMGVMMWLMMRGKHGPQMAPTQTSATPAPSVVNTDEGLAQLRSRLAAVEAEQAAVATEIKERSDEKQPLAASGVGP